MLDSWTLSSRKCRRTPPTLLRDEQVLVFQAAASADQEQGFWQVQKRVTCPAGS